MRNLSLILLTTLFLSSCASMSLCTVEPDVESNPHGETIEDKLIAIARLSCVF
jgi:PBP1b-binding outer membrane lipoprotein LpoB